MLKEGYVMGSTKFNLLTEQSAIDLIVNSFCGKGVPSESDIGQMADNLFISPLFEHIKSRRLFVVDEVTRLLKGRCGIASVMQEEDPSHIPWLKDINRREWRLWPRLETYLRTIDRLPPAVLQELDRSTDVVLDLLESPERGGMWDRRGLVMGHVQSGKTSHYTAVAAKALDAGYEVVIILAGIHNSLRSQTHERIDRYLLGRDSAMLVEALRNPDFHEVGGFQVGVGLQDINAGLSPLPFSILTCTSSTDEGDFKTQVANKAWMDISQGARLVMVVKKNAVILRNLVSWLGTQREKRIDGASLRIAAPALIIDDEADHSSMNVSGDPDFDTTTINRLIRKLLVSFNRVGFVGYTATPFANIFASAYEDHPEYGADLFPQSFIINLKTPNYYIGPGQVFGHDGDEAAGIPEQLPLPMHIDVEDSEDWVPDRHKKDLIPGDLPSSLDEALKLFVLACATRACRGDDKVHNSMLVHATRFINVQHRVASQIEDRLNMLRNIMESGSTNNVRTLEKTFHRIWKEHIVKNHGAFKSCLPDQCGVLPFWDSIWAEARQKVQTIQVKRINGTSADTLEYLRNDEGLNLVAIGGDKLSRGLTLEGLSVSYFLRASRMFDTLMQMGRWFGYRPRYADLCRVYTTPMLYRSFRQIAMATDEFRSDLDYMAATGKTPADFRLRVRAPSEGLLITSANKIRRGERVDVRFAGTIVQTFDMYRKGEGACKNRNALEAFVAKLGTPVRNVRGKPSSHFIWNKVDAATVLEFLSQYEAYSTPSFFNNCNTLCRYINEQVKKNELTEWTVAIISKKGDAGITINGQTYPFIIRTPQACKDDSIYSIRVLTGPSDEAIDLTVSEFDMAQDLTNRIAEGESGMSDLPLRFAARCNRPPKRGLVLLYLLQDKLSGQPLSYVPAVALSFPESDTAEKLSYIVNEIGQRRYSIEDDY